MELSAAALTVSLGLLSAALAVLSGRGFVAWAKGRGPLQAMWGSGMGLAAGAMAIETVVYVGFVSVVLLQGYVFLSAALVGILSLGCTPVIGKPLFARIYTAYILAATAVVAAACFTTPLSLSMVSNGIISGDPPTSLLILSTVVTGPATVVLLASAAVSLRRTWRWQMLLMISGALVLGAGGTLYIASFPIFLYYAEFIGIVLLFAGLVSLSRLPHGTSATSPAHAGTS